MKGSPKSPLSQCKLVLHQRVPLVAAVQQTSHDHLLSRSALHDQPGSLHLSLQQAELDARVPGRNDFPPTLPSPLFFVAGGMHILKAVTSLGGPQKMAKI